MKQSLATLITILKFKHGRVSLTFDWPEVWFVHRPCSDTTDQRFSSLLHWLPRCHAENTKHSCSILSIPNSKCKFSIYFFEFKTESGGTSTESYLLHFLLCSCLSDKSSDNKPPLVSRACYKCEFGTTMSTLPTSSESVQKQAISQTCFIPVHTMQQRCTRDRRGVGVVSSSIYNSETSSLPYYTKNTLGGC